MSFEDRRAEALLLAETAHRGQVRRNGEPYITHPMAVEAILREAGFVGDVLLAGLLHDVVEDGDDSIDWTGLIRGSLGDRVLELVLWVTEPVCTWPRSVRKWWSCKRLAMAPTGAKAIKMADRIHNLDDFEHESRRFRSKFYAESEALYEALSDCDPYVQHSPLLFRLRTAIDEARTRLPG